MTWKVEGKIGYLVGRGSTGGAHWDTYRIVFQPPGSNTQEEIERVIFLPASVIATLANKTDAERSAIYDTWTVWKRYWEENKRLANDSTQDQYLMVKYKPASNINVSKVAVLVDPSGNGSGSDCLIIVNDQGLLIYSAKNQSQESTAADTTLYEYTGYKRTRTFNNSVTLYAGKTYWIHYHFNDCRNHRGAYFENSNGKYKDMGSFSIANFASNTAYPEYANKTIGNTYDVSSTGNINTWEKLEAILQSGAVENDLILLTSNDCGLRTDIASGLTYYGHITGTNGYDISASQINDIPIGKSFIVINSYSSTSYRIMKCKKHMIAPDASHINLTPDTSQSMLDAITLNANNAVSFGNCNWHWDYCNNKSYLRTSNMSVYSSVCIDAPSDPQVGTLYVKDDGGNWPQTIGHNGCIAVYTDNGWEKLTSLDQTFTINGTDVEAFKLQDISECYEVISTSDSQSCGTYTAMNKNSFIQYYDNGSGAQAWNTTQTGKTFYLEINDTEKSNDAERA